MTQLNTPYPATAYLTGFLRERAQKEGRDWKVSQADPAIELVLKLLSRSGLEKAREELVAKAATRSSRAKPPRSVRHFLGLSQKYIDSVDAVIRFLQGRDPSLALRIVGRQFLPEGERFLALQEYSKLGDDPLQWAFGALGVQDQAKYLASLYIDDLADMIREGLDERFALSRYGEKLAASQPTFEPLLQAIQSEPTLVDRFLVEIVESHLAAFEPEVLALTAPFPGNVYAAFRIAQLTKKLRPQTVTVLGGGYPNTELRELAEPRVFDYFDYITLDDGERPLLCLLEHLEGRRTRDRLFRTWVREGEGPNQQVVLKSDSREHDIPHRDTGTPTYDGLPLGSYLSILEMLNPMHRIWSDGRWNKLTLAHGCYWKKCNFCDVSLDYIGRYDPMSADGLVDKIETLVRETGQSGFHFVDEAAPPAVLRALSERLIARGVTISWWGNVRFEKTFTPELAQLMAKAGCVAVSGGLEVASDRLLKLMNKGVTVEQVARVTRALTDAGIMVHAYLMYGFPTQTAQETVDSLERVRQLFEQGCIQSAYWHRFSATVHSPIGKNPEKFGIRLLPHEPVVFARNDLPFEDPTGTDHDFLGEGLRKALYNYMHGMGFELELRHWFDPEQARERGVRVPKPKVPHDLIARALES